MFVVGGESLVDLVAAPQEPNRPLSMSAHAGGSPYNCAIALARLGNETGFLCPLSSDTFGDLLAKPLDEAGVRQLITERSPLNTTLAVVTRNAKGLPAYAFYRQGTAERDISVPKLKAALPQKIELFQIGGFMPIEENDFAVWFEIVKVVAAQGSVISIDPNVRPSLIHDIEGYKARLAQLLDLAHIVKVSNEDLAHLDAGKSVDAHVEALLSRTNVELVVVTLGEAGARGFTRNTSVYVPIYEPEVFGDTVGAGDSLMAGILTALADRGALETGRSGDLAQSELEDVLRFGAVTAGLNCGHIGCHPPSRAEVEVALANFR